MKKMLYYIAESSKSELFTTTLIARLESYEEAVEFCKGKAKEWQTEGYETRLTDIEGEVWGVEAITPWHYNGREETCDLVHLYHIFATPVFMAGGKIG